MSEATITETKTPTLPVLGRPQCDTEEDFELFADHLARWAAQWVPSISVPIMRRARELYDESAVCILLGKWYDIKLRTVRDTHERLLRAAKDEEWSWEREGEVDEFKAENEFDRERLQGYSNALMDLIIGF
jgi:hypothetical protein